MLVAKLDINKEGIENIQRAGGNLKKQLTKLAMYARVEMVKGLKQSIKTNLRKTRDAKKKQQTGHLLQNIAGMPIIKTVDGIEISVGTNVKYARIQDEGDSDHKPITRQFLTIPIGDVSRPPAIAMKATGKTFIRANIIYLKEGESITPVYKLKRSVKIPATHWIDKGTAIFTPRVQALIDAVEVL